MQKTYEESNEVDRNEQMSKIEKKITKRKRKQQQVEEEPKLDCSICFGQIEDKGQIVDCEHTYCFQCIDVWAKKHQTCPQCRKQFKYINRVWKQGNRKRQKKYFYENEVSDISDGLVPVESIFRWISPTHLFQTQFELRTTNLITRYTEFLSNSLALAFASESD